MPLPRFCLSQNPTKRGNPNLKGFNLLPGKCSATLALYILVLFLQGILVTRLKGQPITASDCHQAYMMCGNGVFQITPNGFGNTMELIPGTPANPTINPASANSGCLLLGERNSTWLMIRTHRPGTLEFSFGTPGPVECYDWTMFRYSSSICQQILNNQVTPIRCNWNSPCNSFTGMANILPGGGMASNFEPPLQAGCEDTFLICFSNYGSISTSVRFNFFGTAGISCTQIASLTAIASPPTICFGDSSQLFASHATNVQWSPHQTLSSDTGNRVWAHPQVTTTYRAIGFNGCRMDTAYVTVTVVPPPIIQIFVTPASRCDTCDGSILVNLITPISPSNYAWSNNLGNGLHHTGLCPGTRSFSYNHLGCQRIIPITVGAPSIGSVQTIVTPETCNLADGTATITNISPPGNYQITWNTTPVQTGYTATGLSAGCYIASIFDPNLRCGLGAIVCIPMVRNFQTYFSAYNTTCPYSQDGRIVSTTTGGIPPYQYSWSTTPIQTTSVATGLAPGLYTLIVKDSAGCQRNYRIIINPGPPVVTWNTITPLSCAGLSDAAITMNQPNFTPLFTYVWNTQPAQTSRTITGLSANTYTVWVKDNRGCTTTVVIPIHNPPRLGVNVSATPVSCFGMSNGTASGVPVNHPALYSVTWNLQPPRPNVLFVNNLSPGTYTVSITSRTGCTGLDTFTILEPQPVQINSQSTSPTCFSFNGTIQTSASGGTPGYTYRWSHLPSPGLGPPVLSGLAPGSYTVTVQDTNNCTQTHSINLYPEMDTLSLSPSVQNQSCPNLANGGFTLNCQGLYPPFTCSFNGGLADTIFSFTGLQAGIYLVRVYNSRGCYKDSLIQILLDPTDVPELNIAIQNRTCQSMPNGEITLQAQGIASPFSFSLNNSTPDTISHFPNLTAGTYSIRVFNAQGCYLDTIATVLDRITALSPQLSPEPATCSSGQNGNILANGLGAFPPFLYSLNGNAAGSTNLFSNLSAGTYAIRIIDSIGCFTDTLITLGWVPNTTVPAYSQTPPTCAGYQNGLIQIDTFGMHSPIQFSWTLPSGINTGTAVISASAGTWSLHLIDAWNCAYFVSDSLGEPTEFVLSGTGQNPECFGGNNGQIHLSGSGGTSPYHYTWNQQSITTTLSSLYKGIYYFSAQDAQGCPDSIEIELSEPQAGMIQLQSYPTACPGVPDGRIELNFSGGLSPYRYYLNHIEYPSGIFDSLSQGNYLITVSDANGCLSEEITMVSNLSKLEASVNNKDLICHNKSEGEISLLSLSGTPPFRYSCSGQADQVTPVFTQLPAGFHTVKIVDGRSCVWDSVVQIKQPGAISAKASIIPPDCFGEYNGKASIEITGGSPGYSIYLNQEYLSPSSQLEGLGAGPHTVTISDANGCRRELTLQIPEGRRPDPPRILPDTVCPEESARLLAWTQSGSKPVWYDQEDADAMLFSGDQMNIQEPKRTDTFFVSAIDEQGCESKRIPVRVIVAQNPIAGFLADFQTRELPGAVFSFQDKSVSQAPIQDWFWEFGDGEISSFQHPIHEYAQPGEYTVKLSVVDANGCKATALRASFLEVQMSVMMVPPNAFSPNGDGVNDFFRMPFYNIAQWLVVIYDRWGNVVYQTEELNFNWDGTHQGSPAPEAVYTYTVNGKAVDGTPVSRSGTILLMR
jgi:gliding motility-associated-like protein